MIAELRQLVPRQPFTPFVIHMADGERLHVPTVDHIALAPVGSRVVVFKDKGVANILSALLMSRISLEAESADSVA